MQPFISFSSQCKGRRQHLELTLQHNLNVIEQYSDYGLDFVLLDFDSDDGLLDWIRNNFELYLDDGLLKYFRVENEPYYMYSAVKNLAHRLSTGVNIINVDADNYLSPSYIDRAIEEFEKNPNTLILTDLGEDSIKAEITNPVIFGANGRIGTSREIFDAVLGYDEIITTWGGETGEFIARIFNLADINNFDLNYVMVPYQLLGVPIEHSNELRFRYTDPDDLYDIDPTLMEKTVVNIENELDQIVNTLPQSHIYETLRDFVIKARKEFETFEVQQLVDGELINIGEV